MSTLNEFTAWLRADDLNAVLTSVVLYILYTAAKGRR